MPRPSSEAPSPEHGLLKGADVILLTFESLGRTHLSRAHMPFMTHMREISASSSHHFCVCPTTNNAHLAIYSSQYTARRGYSGTHALAKAGYRMTYVSPIETGHFGLRAMLERAGFETVLDRRHFSPPISDAVLVSQAADRLAERTDDRPLFLHVHTTNTHVPYRVNDPIRFSRFDAADDQGRFMNALEEADQLVYELLKQLGERGLARAPLIVLSADHGQSFGELGYHSHGSAVTKQQIEVPLILHHPALAPREVPFSTHFDLLPSVLDLLGVAPEDPGFGRSIFQPPRPPSLFVWAGHPSRTTTSNFGLIEHDKKVMFDAISDECLAMTWEDEQRVELAGEEKEYYSTLLSRLLLDRGLR